MPSTPSSAATSAASPAAYSRTAADPAHSAHGYASPNAFRTAHSAPPAATIVELCVSTTQAVTPRPAVRNCSVARSNDPAGPATAGRRSAPDQRPGSGR